MGLFGKLFDKKECSVCGGEIGLLGNRKLEDGNLCKDCAAKLSPFFSERRSSTVDEIKEQLAYREQNKKEVENFNTTRTLGVETKLYLDEDQKKFMVTRARNLRDANPDVLDYSQVTDVVLDIDEDTDEDKKDGPDGKKVSYQPPRYFYSYDFKVKISVNHPYFNEITFRLNSSNVRTNPGASVMSHRKPDPMKNAEYVQFYEMGNEIKNVLSAARKQAREEALEASMPKTAVTCPFCGATTMPTDDGCCEYCGGSLKG